MCNEKKRTMNHEPIVIRCENKLGNALEHALADNMMTTDPATHGVGSLKNPDRIPWPLHGVHCRDAMEVPRNRNQS